MNKTLFDFTELLLNNENVVNHFKKDYQILNEDDHTLLNIISVGLKKEDISISIENNVLHLQSKKESDNKLISNFNYYYDLSHKHNTDKITASVDNGILNIKIPFKKDYKKEIKIT